ncbi:MAG: hypothetical protein OHK93_003575 [Ramalina farinacea]|uniref:Heterokaryon incompatibility domain-containing protein n=1 Tax=Ramalina farinacea TaxID=258253 RepID=A0AA43TUS8_9LECA|nr:hypothetical protein [Ramalina farinacea]
MEGYSLRQASEGTPFDEDHLGGKFVFIDATSRRQLTQSRLVTLSIPQKQAVFQNVILDFQRRGEETQQLLSSLQRLSSETAQCFTPKSKQLDDFQFRLICPENGKAEDLTSYIALSYEWPGHEQTSQSAYDEQTGPSDHMPIPPILHEAITKSCESIGCGIWCDQICIQQDDASEKAISIGMMDVIYRQARFVAISLSDVIITTDEHEAIETLLIEYNCHANAKRAEDDVPHLYDEPPHFHTNPHLLSFYTKVMQSAYFDRAWCWHELRMGAGHIFYIQSAKEGCVLELASRFIFVIMMLAMKASHGLEKQPRMPGQETFVSFMRSQSLLDCLATTSSLSASGDADPDLTERQRALSVLRDKAAIVVNDSRLDLAIVAARFLSNLKPDEDLLQYLFRQLSILSMANGDPMPLCTSGQSLPSRIPGFRSWMFQFRQSDEPIRKDRKGDPLKADLSEVVLDEGAGDAWMRLKISHSKGEMRWRRASRPNANVAGLILDAMREEPFEKRGPLHEWMWRMIHTSPPIRNLITATIACCLENGARWILSGSPWAEGSLITALQAKADWQLDGNIALEPYQVTGFPITGSVESISQWLSTPKGKRAAVFIVEFAARILLKAVAREARSSPHPDGGMDSLAHLEPVITSIHGNSYFGVLPDEDTKGQKMVVPTALVDEKFGELRRAWFVEEVEADGEAAWSVISRQRIFGPPFTETMVEYGMSPKMYGPKMP